MISLTNAVGPLTLGFVYDGIDWRATLVVGLVCVSASVAVLWLILVRQPNPPAAQATGGPTM